MTVWQAYKLSVNIKVLAFVVFFLELGKDRCQRLKQVKFVVKDWHGQESLNTLKHVTADPIRHRLVVQVRNRRQRGVYALRTPQHFHSGHAFTMSPLGGATLAEVVGRGWSEQFAAK